MRPGPSLCLLVGTLLVPAASCTDVRNVGRAGAPIQVLVWNNALDYGHAARVNGLPYLQAREASDDLQFDLTYAHTGPGYAESASDTTFDASVFTDAGLEKYDVVLFMHTTGFTLDDASKDTRRQALRDFIEKKGRGFVGIHSATDTYQGDAWPWYVDFIGTNYLPPPGGPYVPGTIQFADSAGHPILAAARTPNPWSRSDEWFTFTRDPLASAISGITVLLTVRDQQTSRERPSAWIHEMPQDPAASRGGRLFYTACCHDTVTFQEPAVIDLIVAGIKWAARRL